MYTIYSDYMTKRFAGGQPIEHMFMTKLVRKLTGIRQN
jgi:hypothetical protein